MWSSKASVPHRLTGRNRTNVLYWAPRCQAFVSRTIRVYGGPDNASEVVGAAMKRRCLACIVMVTTLSGCARAEDGSFAAQAARRGDDCNAIAAGSAMDAYGHQVGPATEIYQNVYQDCLAWQQREAERLKAAR